MRWKPSSFFDWYGYQAFAAVFVVDVKDGAFPFVECCVAVAGLGGGFDSSGALGADELHGAVFEVSVDCPSPPRWFAERVVCGFVVGFVGGVFRREVQFFW